MAAIAPPPCGQSGAMGPEVVLEDPDAAELGWLGAGVLPLAMSAPSPARKESFSCHMTSPHLSSGTLCHLMSCCSVESLHFDHLMWFRFVMSYNFV